jgi:hypothetical protein
VPRATETIKITKPGKPVLEDGKPKLDSTGDVVREDPVVIKTVLVENLTSRQAMGAADFALAISPTGMPSRQNGMRAMAVCAIRQIDESPILAPTSLKEFNDLLERFEPDELDQLASGHFIFANRLEELDDPKDSPPARPSAG